MQALRQFSIPIMGLKIRKHEFNFQIGGSFFNAFENSPINNGDLQTILSFDKKSDHVVLDFSTSGTVKTDCDRCTARIKLPLESEYQVILKYGEGESEDPDVVFVSPEAHEVNVAPMIYEQIILAMPIIKVYDCENEQPRPCNEEVLEILARQTATAANSLGDALKNLKIDKN